MTHQTRLAALAATTALLLSATGAAYAQAPMPIPTMDPAPAGAGVPLATTSWVLKRPLFLLLRKDPTLTFSPDSYSPDTFTASVGCNTVMGKYTVAVPNRTTITVDPSMMQPAAQACSKTQTKAEAKYVNMLSRVTGYNFSSNGKTLTLKGEAGDLKFQRAAYADAGSAMPMTAPAN